MLAVHLLANSVYQLGGMTASNTFYLGGGLSWNGIQRGQLWQIFTHIWLHGFWTHLILNAFLFYYAAARLSHVLSSWRILGLFLICGTGAGVAHVLAQAVFPALPSGPLVGASGGVFGLLLGFFSLSPGSRMLLIPVSARNLSKGVLISSAFLFLFTPGLNLPLMSEAGSRLVLWFGTKIFQISHLAHFVGGFLGVLLIPRFFPRLLTRDDLSRMRQEADSGNEGLAE